MLHRERGRRSLPVKARRKPLQLKQGHIRSKGLDNLPHRFMKIFPLLVPQKKFALKQTVIEILIEKAPVNNGAGDPTYLKCS